jgi:hypothetical protein
MQVVNSRRKAKYNLFEAWLFRLAPLPDFYLNLPTIAANERF